MKNIVQAHESGKIIHVKGGKTRMESVLLGLTAVSEDVVLIHDGVRPWIRPEYINSILDKMKTEKACVLAVKTTGALLQVEEGYVKDFVKQSYVQTQTPQAFRTSFILNCYAIAKGLELNVKDDAELVSRVSDQPIAVIEGDSCNVRYIPKERK